MSSSAPLQPNRKKSAEQIWNDLCTYSNSAAKDIQDKFEKIYEKNAMAQILEHIRKWNNTNAGNVSRLGHGSGGSGDKQNDNTTRLINSLNNYLQHQALLAKGPRKEEAEEEFVAPSASTSRTHVNDNRGETGTLMKIVRDNADNIGQMKRELTKANEKWDKIRKVRDAVQAATDEKKRKTEQKKLAKKGGRR